jgi:hypothetical protein
MSTWSKLRAAIQKPGLVPSEPQTRRLPVSSSTTYPDFMDPDAAGSRFTLRPAFAVLTRPNGASRFNTGDDTGDAQAVVNDALGASAELAAPVLGRPKVIDGSHGRGASGWAPIVEWAVDLVVAGIAWDVLKQSTRQLRTLVSRLRGSGVRIAISRGSAALLAIEHVLSATDESGVLDIEAIDEPSAYAGRSVTELSYTEIEPWLVSLVNETLTMRYVVAIGPDGEVLDHMALPISDAERLYGVPRRSS